MHKANAQKEGIEGSRSCQKRHESFKKHAKEHAKTGKQIVAVIVLYLIIVQLVVPQIVVLIVPLIVVVRIVILSTFIVVAHSLLPTTWLHNGNPWNFLGFFGIFRVYGPIWVHIGPYGPIWGPYGPIYPKIPKNF